MDSKNKDSKNKDSKKMNLQIALDELEISLDDIELTNLNQEYIKKQSSIMKIEETKL